MINQRKLRVCNKVMVSKVFIFTHNQKIGEINNIISPMKSKNKYILLDIEKNIDKELKRASFSKDDDSVIICKFLGCYNITTNGKYKNYIIVYNAEALRLYIENNLTEQ